VLVEFVDHVWTGVCDGIGSIFLVFDNAVARKSANVMYIHQLCRLNGIDVIVVRGRYKRFEVANQVKR